MNKEEKTAVVEELAARLGDASAIFAVDYRGISVPQAAELRSRLSEADASFRVVKNRLAKRAAEKAGTAELEELFEGPIALTFVKGDAVTAAKAIATFARQNNVLDYRGGVMDGEPLEPEKFQEIARLPALDVLHGQLVGVAASPLTGLTRGLASLLSGLAVGLGEIAEKGLVGGGAPPEEPAAEGAAPEEPAAEPEVAEEAEEESEEPEPAPEPEPNAEEQERAQVPVEEAEDPTQYEEGSPEQQIAKEAATGEDTDTETSEDTTDDEEEQ